MGMMESIKKAKQLVEDWKVERVSENIWNVGDEVVKRIVKPGRSLFTCSCESFTRFCLERPPCQHFFAVVLFEAHENFKIKNKKTLEKNT